jgi:hypothetical protein
LAEARAPRDETKRLIKAGKDRVQARRSSKKPVVTRSAATVERYATEHYNAIKHATRTPSNSSARRHGRLCDERGRASAPR